MVRVEASHRRAMSIQYLIIIFGMIGLRQSILYIGGGG